jgi:hypothetical protein
MSFFLKRCKEMEVTGYEIWTLGRVTLDLPAVVVQLEVWLAV